jgi:hypothetical protein
MLLSLRLIGRRPDGSVPFRVLALRYLLVKKLGRVSYLCGHFGGNRSPGVGAVVDRPLKGRLKVFRGNAGQCFGASIVRMLLALRLLGELAVRGAVLNFLVLRHFLAPWHFLVEKLSRISHFCSHFSSNWSAAAGAVVCRRLERRLEVFCGNAGEC